MSIESKKFEAITAEVTAKFTTWMTDPWILVNVAAQNLCVVSETQVKHCYAVSTSQFGEGNEQDSQKTPLGAHLVAECVGDEQSPGAVFKARQATGEVASIITSAEPTNLDLIITRILRLRGIEPGINQGDGVDSYQRYIYIHGTHEEGLLGTPASHGCVRMSSEDIIHLYSQVCTDTFVYIT